MKQRKKLITVCMAIFITTMLVGFSTYNGGPPYQEYKEYKLILYLQEQNSIINRMLEEMESIPHTEDVSIDFLYGMIAHHEGAIDISKILLKYGGENKEVKTISENIVADQSEEIKTMENLIKELEAKSEIDTDKEKEYLSKYNKILEKNKIREKFKPISVDEVFIKDMIKHHEMGIEMSQLVLEYTNDMNIKNIAKNIIEKQNKEIKKMKTILANIS